MRIINAYIRNAVISSTFLVVMVLLGVELLMEFVGELSDIGTAHYDMAKAMLYVPMLLPSDLYQLFPMAGFLGCLLGLGRLASTSELIVIRAAGVSMSGIAWSVVKAAILMMCVVTVVGETIAPALEAGAHQIKTKALQKQVNYQSQGGIWLRNAGEFVHIGKIVSDVEMKDVAQFKFDDQHHLQSAAVSAKGVLKNDHWELLSAKQTVFKKDHTVTHHLRSLPISVVFAPTFLQEDRKSVDQQSVLGLAHSIDYRERAGLESNRYQFAFWQRIIQPFATIIMICLGVPFIFGSLRSASMGSRILTGVVVGFSFYMLNQFFGPVVMVYQFPAALAALIPSIIFALVCVILLRRAQ